MPLDKLTGFCFSPTGNSDKIMSWFLTNFNNFHYEKTGRRLINEVVDLCEYEVRSQLGFKREFLNECVVFALPVYAGRVPNILLKSLSALKGNNTPAVILMTFGNRDFDDAPKELAILLERNGFSIMGIGVVVASHAFSDTITPNHPTQKDEILMRILAETVVNRCNDGQPGLMLDQIPGEDPPRPYYRPKDIDGGDYAFRKIMPETLNTCIQCGICAKKCPMQSISYENFSTIVGVCIKCCRCVKRCPENAKVFRDKNFLKHKLELEHQLKVIQTSIIITG